VISVFVYSIQKAFQLSTVFAAVAVLGGLFVTGQGLRRENEDVLEDNIPEEDFAETVARVVDRRLSNVERRSSREDL